MKTVHLNSFTRVPSETSFVQSLSKKVADIALLPQASRPKSFNEASLVKKTYVIPLSFSQTRRSQTPNQHFVVPALVNPQHVVV